MREQLKILVSLQEKEVGIGRIESALATIDERVNALIAELATYDSAVCEQEQMLSEIKKQYRSNEDEVKMIEAQVVKSKEKLSAVKTNKEYQSMLKEIDELKNKSSGIEDQMLEDLDRIEAYESNLVERKADLADAQAEINQKQEEIHRKAGLQKGDLENLIQDRNDVRDTLEDKVKGFYETVKRQGNGIAVAAILDGICQVCRINIPPQLFNELMRMDRLRMCPNCQRIMYPKSIIEEELTI